MGAAGPLRMTVLGSGTSVGVPTPGCHCSVCTSADPRDNRLRPSVLLQYAGHNVVIDTTPDFRTQMLRAKIDRKSTRLNSSHTVISYAVFCLQKKRDDQRTQTPRATCRKTH